MNIRLTGGVVAAEQCAWAPGAAGPVRVPGPDGRPGAAVALGPEDAGEEDVRRAVAALRRLVADGDEAAGAGVDLGGGFRSGRLAGAHGDRRDAVLAALRSVGPDDVERLGDRAGVLVALFGPSVTKRVGAAAAKAAGEGRWDALHLASAASDVLGPEQLEAVLELDAPEDVVRGGSPSLLARNLRHALDGVPRARRLQLVLDLWNRVAEHHAERARRERRRATQGKRDRVGDLRACRRRYENDAVMQWAECELGKDVQLGDALRWVPPKDYWTARLAALHQDALAATALLRTAVAVADHGIEEGLARSERVLAASLHEVPESRMRQASKRVPGLTGHPARPIVYARDLRRCVGRRADAKLAAYAGPRLTCARDYAKVVVQEVVDALDEDDTDFPESVLRHWLAQPLAPWRRDAGYGGARPPEQWDARLVRWLDPDPVPVPLNARLDGRDPAEAEVVGDLLWYAELVDELARVHGRDAACTTPGTGAPWFEHDPEPDTEEPLVGYEAVPQAVSGAAQLAALGGVPPRRARTWPVLVDGLLAGTAVTAALTGEFPVPAQLLELDGAEVGGHRVKVARNARDLAEWSAYMGNCLGTVYVDDAREGRSVLVGLYGADGLLAANAELLARRPAARGWYIGEILGRFNHPADEALADAFRERVDRIHRTAPAEPDDASGDDEVPPSARPVRRRAGARLLQDAGPALRDAVRLDDRALAALTAVAAPTALARLDGDRLAAECARALDGGADLVRLWDATARRPLRDAVADLDPAVRDRFDRLPLLAGEPPLPKSLRRLVKLPVIADAYAFDLAARRVRRAIGLLAVRDDPALARAVRRRTTGPPLCALTVLTTCAADGAADGAALAPVTGPRAATVPGFPATTLADEDGPWRRALPAARELGAEPADFWAAVDDRGLRVPASWLPPAGWPALWARAHR